VSKTLSSDETTAYLVNIRHTVQPAIFNILYLVKEISRQHAFFKNTNKSLLLVGDIFTCKNLGEDIHAQNLLTTPCMLSHLHRIPEHNGQTIQTDRIAIPISCVSVLTRDKNQIKKAKVKRRRKLNTHIPFIFEIYQNQSMLNETTACQSRLVLLRHSVFSNCFTS